MLCNNATLGGSDEDDSGDPMELALLRAGATRGLERPALRQTYPTVRRHAFDTASKMMATVHRAGDGFLFAVKGAPEAVVAAADRVASRRRRPRHGCGRAPANGSSRVEHLGHHGLRVLACASKTARQRRRAALRRA